MVEKRYLITYHKDECIGAFACLAAEPKSWVKNEDKADLVDAKNEGNEIFTKEVDDLDNNLEAAQCCPVNCIHIYDRKEKRKLI